MLNIVCCPKCGHQCRIPELFVGKELHCPACNLAFVPLASDVIERAKEPSRERETEPFRQLMSRFGDPAMMLEGAMGGILGGVLAGICLNAIAALLVFYADPDFGSALARLLGGLLASVLVGFIAGTFSGWLIVAGGYYVRSYFAMTAERAALLAGALAGCAVTFATVGLGWFPLGLFLGAAGGLVWLALRTWTRAHFQGLR
jgi:hypothetical protein